MQTRFLTRLRNTSRRLLHATTNGQSFVVACDAQRRLAVRQAMQVVSTRREVYARFCSADESS